MIVRDRAAHGAMDERSAGEVYGNHGSSGIPVGLFLAVQADELRAGARPLPILLGRSAKLMPAAARVKAPPLAPG
jgi:hypothetical protein